MEEKDVLNNEEVIVSEENEIIDAFISFIVLFIWWLWILYS